MGQRVFLIDGTAFCYRAFYAIRNLATAQGRPTNAVYGVATMLKALKEKEHPDGLAVAFDTGKPTFRHKQFEQYKIQRKPMPQPLIAQIPVVKQLLAAHRIPIYECEGYEGEDVLATIAKQIGRNTAEIFLVTGDKDALQLVNNHIKVYNPHKQQLVFDAQAVRERYGLGPAQIVDLMALMGDDIDNIPGVAGIGEKTAVELLKQFGSVEQLYERLPEVSSPARRKALEDARKQVQLSRLLAQIDTSVPIAVSLEELKIQQPDWKKLRALYRELEFKKLLSELDSAQPTEGSPGDVVLAVQKSEIEAVLRQLKRQTPAAIGCWPMTASDAADNQESFGVLLAVSLKEHPVWVATLEPSSLATAEGKAVAVWLADSRAHKIGFDVKAAMRLLSPLGCQLEGVVGDAMIAAYLVNPARTNPALADLADEYLDERLAALPQSVDAALARQPANGALFARAASVLWRLHEKLEGLLKECALEKLYQDLELPLASVLARMEITGIAVDRQYLTELKAKMDGRLLQLTQAIYRLAGGSFNLNSPKQLAEVLFERLKLPVIKRTKTGPSTDADVLRQLAQTHPLPKELLEYRELAKLVSTYVEALVLLADPVTHRVHTSFNQTATATGRLSSSEPNLQNIPIRTDLGRSIRRAFVPAIAQGILMAADYSQVELRLLAHLSGDETLSEAFRRGHDIHRYTACLIYDIPEEEVQPSQRSAMKAVNFGILYGMSAHGLSKELGISFEEAQSFITAYFERYPKVRAYLDGQIAKARQDGFVQTLLGRRRYIPEVNSTDAMMRQLGERMAINAPVQGTAADLIKQAMVDVDAALRQEKLKSRMALQVHDELVFEVPKAELSAAVALIRRIMESAFSLSVPLVVTVKAGPNWLDLSEIK